MDACGVKRSKLLQEENARSNKTLADLSLYDEILTEIITKKLGL